MDVFHDNYTDVYEVDIVDAYSHYLEGYILVPVGVLGMIGKLVRVKENYHEIIRFCYIFLSLVL